MTVYTNPDFITMVNEHGIAVDYSDKAEAMVAEFINEQNAGMLLMFTDGYLATRSDHDIDDYVNQETSYTHRKWFARGQSVAAKTRRKKGTARSKADIHMGTLNSSIYFWGLCRNTVETHAPKTGSHLDNHLDNMHVLAGICLLELIRA